METVDNLIELLEKYRGYKLNVVVSTLRTVGNSLFPENQHGKLVFCDSSHSEKEIMLELETGEELTYINS